VELVKPEQFINRELSWLAFNERVLAEARDATLPLFERLKFMGIVSSNLDEFFMVRVAGLKQQLLGGVADPSGDGMLPAEQLTAIAERAHQMAVDQYRTWRDDLLPGLAAAGLAVMRCADLSADQKAAAKGHFVSNVFPALTPLAIDPGHPFPHLRNKSLNLALILRRDQGKGRKKAPAGTTSLAVVQVPSVLPRLVTVPVEKGQAFVLLEDLIATHAAELFPGFAVMESAAFRVTRNWDLAVDEEESEDLLSTIQDELRRRDRGASVRLELHAQASPAVETALRVPLGLVSADVYRLDGPLQLNDMGALSEFDARTDLRVERFEPAVPAAFKDAESVFGVLGSRDVLLHHPYESFEPVVRFIEEAADDPQVLAIKQTLYRTGGESPLIRALARAAENGKQVAVLVEIKARFDEANNIAWARRLEESGVHVVYGLIGLKTHCKVALVVRREGSGIRRYVHLGTGNYNQVTAKQYTDLSLFTARKEMAEDVTALFNMLTGNSLAPQWKRLAVAPIDLRERVLGLIDREADRAKGGQPARIVAKMNSLVDERVIRALYRASQAGVEIELQVRGICCLRPGLPGVSERVRVVSVVDRFLEHSRVFAFGVGEATEVFISSADWMPRNFVRRVEVLAPVEDPALRTRLLDEVLALGLRDNVKGSHLQPDGTYTRPAAGEAAVRSQMALLELARGQGGTPAPVSPIRFVVAGAR
jgi:polyphosphate kinase